MKNAKQLFENAAVDAVVVISDKNRFYFTEFASTFGFLVLMPERTVFLTDPRYLEMADALKNEGVEVRPSGENVYGQIGQILEEAGVRKVGYEDNELTVAQFSTLRDKLPTFEFVAVGEQINLLRSVKDEREIEYIRKAQSITDLAFSEILKELKVGMTEKDVAVELEYRMRKNGASGLAFDTIVASGLNTSKPHAHPTDKTLEHGDALTMDFGAAYNGYCSDMTRTVFLGEPSEKMQNIYNVVLYAQRTAIKNAYCGMTGKELDSFAREIIIANGYGEYFSHSTGHSLGIDIHESPNASVRYEGKIGANQLITVEPGIYIPGVGGVRIEDLLLVKEDEVIDLTTSEKNIIIL